MNSSNDLNPFAHSPEPGMVRQSSMGYGYPPPSGNFSPLMRTTSMASQMSAHTTASMAPREPIRLQNYQHWLELVQELQAVASGLNETIYMVVLVVRQDNFGNPLDLVAQRASNDLYHIHGEFQSERHSSQGHSDRVFFVSAGVPTNTELVSTWGISLEDLPKFMIFRCGIQLRPVGFFFFSFLKRAVYFMILESGQMYSYPRFYDGASGNRVNGQGAALVDDRFGSDITLVQHHLEGLLYVNTDSNRSGRQSPSVLVGGYRRKTISEPESPSALSKAGEFGAIVVLIIGFGKLRKLDLECARQFVKNGAYVVSSVVVFRMCCPLLFLKKKKKRVGFFSNLFLVPLVNICRS